MDILGKLPEELAVVVLGYLTPEELFVCMRVSRRWKAVANNEWLWSRINRWYKYFPGDDDNEKTDMDDDDRLCAAARKWLRDRITRNNWINENCRVEVVMQLPVNNNSCVRRSPRKVGDWFTVDKCTFVTEAGDMFRLPPQLPGYLVNTWKQEEAARFILSPNSLFLAVPSSSNFVFLLARRDRDRDFRVIALLGPAASPEVNKTDGAGMEVVNLLRRGDECRMKELCGDDKVTLGEEDDDGFQMIPHLFTGFSPKSLPFQRRLVMSHKSTNSLVFWDVHRCRAVSCKKVEAKIVDVKEGWGRGGGICVSFSNDSIAAFDLNGNIIQHIRLSRFKWALLTFKVMTNASVVVLKIKNKTPSGYRLVDWSRGESEVSVLAGSSRDLEFVCGEASIAYYSCDKTITVLAAPDWVTVAHLHSFSLYRRQLHLFDFADGFALIVVLAMYRRHVENEFVIYKVDLSGGGGPVTPERWALVRGSGGRALSPEKLTRDDVILSATSRRLLVFSDNKFIIKRFTTRGGLSAEL